MAKKRKGSEQEEKQLLLFDRQDDLEPEQSDDSGDDWLQDDLDSDFEPSDRTGRTHLNFILSNGVVY